MKKSISLKILSVFCVIVFVFMALSTFAFSEKKEMVQKLIEADVGGEITLEGRVTIDFGPGVLTKDTKISIIYFGDGLYQFGPEIKIEEGMSFTVCFEDDIGLVETFEKGEWIDVIEYYGGGCFETDHFSRYRGC